LQPEVRGVEARVSSSAALQNRRAVHLVRAGPRLGVAKLGNPCGVSQSLPRSVRSLSLLGSLGLGGSLGLVGCFVTCGGLTVLATGVELPSP
jgi:hypothetical protein